MKKIILTGVALMAFAAAGFAQNNASYSGVGTGQTSTQNQSGNQLTSDVVQGNTTVGANAGNTVLTDQKGTGNKTLVTQTTSQFNQGFVFQNTNPAITGAGNNEAIIEQTGSGKTVQQAFDLNSFGIPAADQGNVARIGQEKNTNAAFIQQTSDGSGNNYSNFARIDQSGEDNKGAAGTLGGSVPVSPTDGTGILQNGLSYQNAARITQSGDGNTKALIDQSNDSHENLATVDQAGNLNKAGINQTDDSRENTATVNQTGNSNDGTVNQMANSHNNDGTITQAGTSGIATIDQVTESANNKATVTQGVGGTTNTATVTQSYAYGPTSNGAPGLGSGGNEVEVKQNTNSMGGNNVADVLQGSASATANITSGSKVVVTQEDNVNQTYLTQTGQTLTANISQTGNNNVVRGTGTGMASGDPAIQTGSNYTLTITQSGGMSAGNSNTAAVNSNNVGGGGVTITQVLMP